LSDSEASEIEIPPAITCARCGEPQCEGCVSSLPFLRKEALAARLSHELDGILPWERQSPQSYAQRLITTALATAHPEQACFKAQHRGSLWDALHFACVAETLAITSFAIPWAIGFGILFPSLSLQMMKSGEVRLMGAYILLTLIASVVLLHIVWGAALEWAIGLNGATPNYAQGQRLGLYACGWDLLASPAGVVFLWIMGDLNSALRGVKEGAKVPKKALLSYLSDGRHLDRSVHGPVLRICFAVTSVFFVSVAISVPIYLLWPWF
jgi:hypothetical protein